MTNEYEPHGYAICKDFSSDATRTLWLDADIVEEVMMERLSQYNKFGNQSGRQQHELLSILVEEVGEVAKDINDATYKKLTKEEYKAQLIALRTEWVQVAAVAVQGVGAVDKLLDGLDE